MSLCAALAVRLHVWREEAGLGTLQVQPSNIGVHARVVPLKPVVSIGTRADNGLGYGLRGIEDVEVVDGHGLIGIEGAGHGFSGHLADPVDPQAPLFPILLELDPGGFDAEHRAHEGRKHTEEATCLSGQDGCKSLLLLRRCPLIQIEGSAETAIGHGLTSRRIDHDHGVQPVEAYRAIAPLLHIESEHDMTAAIIGARFPGEVHGAGTTDPAVAVLEVLASERPFFGHCSASWCKM